MGGGCLKPPTPLFSVDQQLADLLSPFVSNCQHRADPRDQKIAIFQRAGSYCPKISVLEKDTFSNFFYKKKVHKFNLQKKLLFCLPKSKLIMP